MRVHKTGNFTVMSNYHFKEKGMSLKAKGLLSLMLSLPDDWNYSVSGLVSLSKDGKDSVMNALGELEKFGYLTRVRMTNEKGQFQGIEYNIYEQPQGEKPVAANPIQGKTNEEKRIAEKPPQLNTNQLSTNDIKDIKELKTKNKGLVEVLETVPNYELRELYQEYIEVRESIDAPLTARGLRMLIDRCNRLSKNNVKVQVLLLETAIINNWKNVYLPNEAEVAAISEGLGQDLKGMFGIE